MWKAVEELQVALNIQTLGELDEWAFDEYSYLIKDENRLKRARHAVLENQRTLKAQAALQAGDLEKFGRFDECVSCFTWARLRSNWLGIR